MPKYHHSNTEVLMEVVSLPYSRNNLGPLIMLQLDRQARTVTDTVTGKVVAVPEWIDLS